MKLVREEVLIDCGLGSAKGFVSGASSQLKTAIQHLDYPPGTGKFTIFPESGKKSGEGNGVRPIRDAFIARLASGTSWKKEHSISFGIGEKKPGPVDAVLTNGSSIYCVEWETGNISSCHRSLNKMAEGLRRGVITAASVIVPTRIMYAYLTDRVANFEELIPFFEFWKSIPVSKGYLSILAVEHDSESKLVPRIRKGTDGRARR